MDADRFAGDLQRGLAMIMTAARTRPDLAAGILTGMSTNQVAEPRDTNPDAAIAEAAQEAIEEPVHGQDRSVGYWQRTAENWRKTARARAAELNTIYETLAAVTIERDGLQAEQDKLTLRFRYPEVLEGHRGDDLGQTPIESAIRVMTERAEQLAKMTAERDAMKAKVDDARDSMKHVKRCVEIDRGSAAVDMTDNFNTTIEWIDEYIKDLESK